MLISAIAQKEKAKQAAVGAPPQTPRKFTPAQAVGGLALALTVLIGVALVSPFLELASGFGGIINVVIILIGLRQAWRLTKPDEAAIAGPYSS